METPEGEVYERRYWTNGTDSMAALYDGDGNRVFRMEYGGRTGGGSVSGAEKEETSESITQETGGEAGRSGSPLIPHAWETEEEQEEVTETRNNIFWYGFGQGLIQGLTTVPGYLSRWLHEHWEYILRRIDVHKDYEVHTFTEGGDEARKPKEGDTWTAALYDEIFIPYQVGEAARENYVETSYVNDVNRAYAETLMEYQADGSAASIYEYGIQRLSYTDTGSQELFTYLYDGRGSVSNLTSQSGASVLSYVYDAYGMSTAYNSTDGNNPTSGTGNPYSYNGEYTDPDTGFQYLRSRYYNSQTGSFLTEDSYSGSILEPLSQNRYIYTGNNPVNLADPGGHAWISGTAAKVAAAAKKTTSKPGAVKSGAATAVKNATKKAVTSTKNTVSTSGQKSKGSSKQNLSKGVKTASTKQQKIVTTSSKSSGSSSAKKSWESAVAGSITGIAASVVRRLTPGHSYINNKLFTASSAKERKLCSNAGRATAGVKPTTATVAPVIPGVFEGLGALLSALEGALAGAVGGVVGSVILPVALVAAVAALGIGAYKYLSEEKVALTPTIAEQILEMARKKKEEQETIKVGPEDYDVLDKDGNVIYKGGGGSQNNNDDGEEKPAPVEPKPESRGSSSENVPEVSGESGKYSEEEIKNILDNLRGDGFKNNPLRQAYENEVAGLKEYGEELLESGMSEEQVARTLNKARRDLGIKYKNATPQPLRDYIYEINMKRYGDILGPTYDWLVNTKGATNIEIIDSSSRPNLDIDKLLSGFEEWLRGQ